MRFTWCRPYRRRTLGPLACSALLVLACLSAIPAGAWAQPASSAAPTPAPPVLGSALAIVRAGGTDLYDAGGNLIANLAAGAALDVTGRTPDSQWLYAATRDRTAGWVSPAGLLVFGTARLPVRESFAGPKRANGATATPVAAASGAAPAAPAAASGTSPANKGSSASSASATPAAAGRDPSHALPVPDGPQTLAKGQRIWYAYKYAGDNSQVTIDMRADPGGSATFAVWAPEDLRRWALGGEEQPMGRGAPNKLFDGDMIWTGNSKEPNTYYVAVDQSGPAPATFTLKVTGSGIAPLEAPTPPSAAPAGAPSKAWASPAGAPSGELAFQDHSGGSIYIYDFASGAVRKLTDGADPAITRDGRTVAFWRDTGQQALYAIGSDGTGERAILTRGELVRAPSWRPDGERLVFTHVVGQDHCRDAGYGICLPDTRPYNFVLPLVLRDLWGLASIDRNGQGYLDLAAARNAVEPSWAEKGIVYGAWGIQLTQDSTDASANESVLGEYRYQDPALQPGGDRIIYQSQEKDHWEIFAVNADGSNRVALTRPATTLVDRLPNNVAPAWSPDGQHIVFLSDRTGKWQLWVMNADGSSPRPLPIDVPIEYNYQAEQVVSWGN